MNIRKLPTRISGDDDARNFVKQPRLPTIPA